MSGQRLSRAALFRGRLQADPPPPPRPPWAVAAFADLCDGCGKCVPVCETQILALGADDKPTVSFADAGCSLCGECVAACPTGALVRAEGARPWPQIARIGAACLSYNGVECRACGDHCPEGAIRFQPMGRGRWLPTIDAAGCSGCGACLAPCPNRCVTLEPLAVPPPSPTTVSRSGDRACA